MKIIYNAESPEQSFKRFVPNAEVTSFLEKSRSGSKIVYHTGYLAYDARMEGKNKDLRHIRTEIQIAYDRGHVELIQRRLSSFVYEYVAIVKPKPPVARNYFFDFGKTTERMYNV